MDGGGLINYPSLLRAKLFHHSQWPLCILLSREHNKIIIGAQQQLVVVDVLCVCHLQSTSTRIIITLGCHISKGILLLCPFVFFFFFQPAPISFCIPSRPFNVFHFFLSLSLSRVSSSSSPGWHSFHQHDVVVVVS